MQLLFVDDPLDHLRAIPPQNNYLVVLVLEKSARVFADDRKQSAR
jgi:hypothetical protein